MTLDAIVLGSLLGFANTSVIALGFAAMQGKPLVAAAVFTYAVVPALVIGLLSGWFARLTVALPRWLRLPGIALLPVWLVLTLAYAFDAYALVPHALAPTLVGCMLLERWTHEDHELAPAVARLRR